MPLKSAVDPAVHTPSPGGLSAGFVSPHPDVHDATGRVLNAFHLALESADAEQAIRNALGESHLDGLAVCEAADGRAAATHRSRP